MEIEEKMGMERNRYRVLIADDEVYVRDLLAKNIRESDVLVDVIALAGDGKAALEAAKIWRPEIIITDIAMPFLNGLELIKELQRLGISSKNILISGYDEFEYAKQAISLGVTDYLLKPFLPKELIAVLKKSVEELDNQKNLSINMKMLEEQVKSHAGLAREHFLKEIFEGTLEEKPEIFRKADELELNLNAVYYIAGVVRFQGGWKFETQEKVEEFLMLIDKGYFASGINIYAVSFDKTQLAMLFCGKSEDKKSFCKLVQIGLEKIAVSMGKYYHTTILCGLGTVKTNLYDVKNSYQEAMCTCWGVLDIREEKTVRFYEKDFSQNGDSRENINAAEEIREWKNRIRLAVKAGHQEEALSLLKSLMKVYVSLANRKIESIGVSIGELIYALANDMETEGYERESPEEIFEFEEKMKYGSLMDLREILESYIKKCCQSIEQNSDQTRANTMVKQVKMLLETNLKNPEIDLEWAASNVHFSASYVRQAFKQITGEGFGEYLIRKRMEKAGMLLQKTELRIQEIAEECGYDNQRYFASSFKKFYGCTPTEFKKVVQEEKLY